MKVDVPDIGFVSVICWDASFREHFSAIECIFEQDLPADRYELIFVEFYQEASPQVRKLLEGRPNARISVLGNPHPGRENEHLIGACVNEGIRLARGDLIVVPDADVLFERDFLSEVVRQHEHCEELALYFYRVNEPDTERPVERTIEAIRAVGSIGYSENYGACLTVRKKWLEANNGYEEDPLWRGYCSVDQDVARRLKTLGLCIKWHPSKFLYHGYHIGTGDPDPASRERVYVQRRVYEARARQMVTLPDKGMDPARRPPQNMSATTGHKRHWIGRAVRRALPYRLRGRLSSMLME